MNLVATIQCTEAYVKTRMINQLRVVFDNMITYRCTDHVDVVDDNDDDDADGLCINNVHLFL